jgi:hypothetical protein
LNALQVNLLVQTGFFDQFFASFNFATFAP